MNKVNFDTDQFNKIYKKNQLNISYLVPNFIIKKPAWFYLPTPRYKVIHLTKAT